MSTTTFPNIQRTLYDRQFRPMNQEEMLNVLEPHLSNFQDVLLGPWEDFQDYRENDKNFIDMKEGDCAVWLTMQAQIRARELLDGKPGFRLIDLHQKLVIVVDEKIAVTIKKLTMRQIQALDRPHLERSNYTTKRNVKLWNQQRDAEIPDFPRVILGYQLLKEITEIHSVIAYCRSRTRRVEWAHALPLVAASAPIGFTPKIAATSNEEYEDKGFTISETDAATQTTGTERASGQ